MIKEKRYILDTKNYYDIYFIDDEPRDLVLIAPGGAYNHTSLREGKPVADFYLKNGFNAAVVKYRESLDVYPKPGMYYATAIKELRKDKRVKKIIGLGFSAGGHLVLEETIHYKEYDNARVDLLILCYPVVTSNKKYAHIDSFKFLLNERYNDEALLKKLSLEDEITVDIPDTFLWNTYTDEAVNVMNSILLVEAYNKVGANIEYHMYSKGGHGLSMGNKKTSGNDDKYIVKLVTTWPKLSLNWLKEKL